MKVLASLALAASVAASVVEAVSSASSAAPVYLLRSSHPTESSSSSSPPALPRQIVRQILLQRIGATDATSFAESLPEGGDVDTEAVLGLLRLYGVAAPSLFGDDAIDSTGRRNPRQLVIAVEGVQPQHAKVLEDALALSQQQRSPAFTVADPPSHAANERLFFGETAAAFSAQGLPPVRRSDVAGAFALDFPATWEHGLFMGFYDLKKSPATIDTIIAHLPQLLALVDAGDVEALLLLLPETSRSSKLSTWTSKPLTGNGDLLAPPPKKQQQQQQQPVEQHEPTELKVRFAAAGESVLLEDEDEQSAGAADGVLPADGAPSPKEFFAATHVAALGVAAESGLAQPAVAAGAPPIVAAPAAAAFVPPSCFQSFNACIAQTNECSGHGTCVDKFVVNGGGGAAAAKSAAAAADGPEEPEKPVAACFVCHCYSTLNRPEDAPGGLSTTQWAGSMCQKQDVSVPFWLLTGFGVAMVGAVSFAIGLLFSVGEEKLPGVIGAGVSRK